MKSLWTRAVAIFDSEDDPKQAHYDPTHLGLALVLTLTTIGIFYWMLWTLLVYEGGLFRKILPALQVALRLKSAGDFGYRGPWDRGIFEGLLGNVGALIACSLTLRALHRLYWAAASKARR